ncbi:hypothetical protein Bca52824_081412 [Brassica carinata]|uniref:non-specific serine/threonine protein kinase n=1 Tax=Brassica carinata TaxID=52824 RepID=A0A8X7PGB7_BRACI|nr:hypothetical protein Bca52824_081412 [Brassica carinata]
MTNNFQRVLGKGGFGTVYHGNLDDAQVAVKMLSHSSAQGYKEFKAEVELLLRVHHKNLVNLVGYCDEGENMALIYEYMSNGDLKEHMSGKIITKCLVLSLIKNDCCGLGLEYLHNGCKPPMVHRDVKTTNILLNEHFEAKLADFGLSRSFPIEGETHVSTVVAGTPGYLDPEYPDDVYDRRWFPLVKKDWNLITTTLNVNTSNGFDPPQGAMASAATYVNDNGTWDIPWNMEDSTTRFHIYLHFAEIQTLLANETREFSVLLNGNEFSKPFSPKMLGIVTMITQPESTLRCESGACLLQLVKTTKSTLPPLLNAMEIFTVVELPQPETNQDEVVAINKIQSAYGLSRVSWQGDPCVPREFLWAGLNCNNTDTSTPPTITSLNLSSSGLTDIIMPAIQNLTNLQELDLSNNSLNGDVPEFLADMKSLFIINLSGNNLSGQVPQKLLQKKGLKLNFEGNPNLNCTESSCVNKPRESGHPKKSIIVPVVASVASMVIIGSALVTFFVLKRKKTSNNREKGRRTPRPEPPKITKKKRFSYAEVTEMTNNFERILGRGGFGMVYHGYVNGTEQVAVKVVSQGSDQGHKQFKAEVDLLLRVHHKNLVGLVGYCEKGKDLVLVYEYMSNGDLKEVLSGKHHSSVLRWGTRLKIAVDAAQGYFGVVLLEIITNLPLIDQRRETPYIAEWVGLMVTKGDIKSIIDPRLKDDYHSDSVWKFVELAMACVNFSSASRPTMSQVVIELIECLTLENSRGGTSCDMESRGSREVTMTFGTEVNPTAR